MTDAPEPWLEEKHAMNNAMTDTLDKIRAEIAALEQRLDALKKRKTEAKEWPQEGNRYWALDITGDIKTWKWDGSNFDLDRFRQGNGYRTKAEAERARDRRALEVELRKRAGDFKPDWGNAHQCKYFIIWNNACKEWDWNWSTIFQYPGSIYFPAKDDALIAEYGDRLNLLLDQEVKP